MAEVSGGGSIAVASPELFEHAHVHAELADVARQLDAALAQIDRVVASGLIVAADAPHSALVAERAIARARGCLGVVAIQAQETAWSLQASAVAYGLVDRAGEFAADALGGLFGWLFARPLALGAAVFGLTAGATIWAVSGGDVAGYLREHPELTANPVVGGIGGWVSEHADELAVGLLGLPLAVAPLLGGAEGVTRGLIAAGSRLGLLRETPVFIAEAKRMPAPAPPVSLGEAGDRLRSMEASGAQLIVEQYEFADGSSVANVYVDGTKDWSLGATDEPLDMTSNAWAMSGAGTSGMALGIELALQDAGIDRDTPVQIMGFSQGGIQAALVASRGNFDVSAVVAIGSPIGGFEVPDSTRMLLVAHAEDPIVALNDDPAERDNTVVYRDERYDGGTPLPDLYLAGHQWPGYRQTLADIDGSAAPVLVEQVQQYLGAPAGAISSRSTAYVLERGGACTPEDGG